MPPPTPVERLPPQPKLEVLLPEGLELELDMPPHERLAVVSPPLNVPPPNPVLLRKPPSDFLLKREKKLVLLAFCWVYCGD